MKLTLLALSLALFGLSGCRKDSVRYMPQDLIGAWETQAPKYRNCLLHLERASVAFENTREEHTTSYEVARVRTVQNGEEPSIEIYYRNDSNSRSSLALVRAGETLRFKYQPDIVWTRRK